MTWPTTPISTEHLDAGTDSPASARADIKSAVDNINAIAGEFGDVDTTGKTTDDVLAWSGTQWAPDTLATVARSGSYTDLTDQPAAYTLPTASTTVLGGVKVDGTTITIDGSGVISSAAGGGSGGGSIASIKFINWADEMTTGDRIISMEETSDINNLISMTNVSTLFPGYYRSFRVAESGVYAIESSGLGVQSGTTDIIVNLVSGSMSSASTIVSSDITLDGTVTYNGSIRNTWSIPMVVVSLSAGVDYIFKHNNTTYSSSTYRIPIIKITRLS
jgi:hypothetical protein